MITSGRYCAACGASVAPVSRFCDACGTPVGARGDAEAQSPSDIASQTPRSTAPHLSCDIEECKLPIAYRCGCEAQGHGHDRVCGIATCVRHTQIRGGSCSCEPCFEKSQRSVAAAAERENRRMSRYGWGCGTGIAGIVLLVVAVGLASVALGWLAGLVIVVGVVFVISSMEF